MALRQSIARSVQAHGGGWQGVRGVARRVLQVLRVLGLRGLWQGILAGSRPPAALAMPVDAVSFPAPAPLSQLGLRVGVMAHVYYGDLVDEFAEHLAHMPLPFTLLVSVVDAATEERVRATFSRLANVTDLKVRIVPNRGRDIAPVFVTFREDLLQLDVFAHIHTKKSLYTGSVQDGWRRYLLDALLGNRERIAWQLGMFQAMPRLGLMYPDTYSSIPLWAHAWLQNLPIARALCARMGLDIEPDRFVDFPVGAMFWARVDALRPLFALKLATTDFPEEAGQSDGTLHHAVERLPALVARSRGFTVGLLPQDGRLSLQDHAISSWYGFAQLPFARRLALSSIDVDLVSFDVFDTLVLRPFLTAAGARAFLGHVARQLHGIEGFVEARELAEQRARARLQHDPTLRSIYEQMARMPGHADWPVDALRELELSLEQTMLRTRHTIVAPLARLQAEARRIALSDMYLERNDLQRALPPQVLALATELQVSCETGRRKDDPATWHAIAHEQGVAPARWLHIGDNELSDVQVPLDQGLRTPIHVPKPAMLLDAHPALRQLRPARFDTAPWQDQLWLGLLANRFALAFDADPDGWRTQPQLDAALAGYAVLGPLAADFCGWLARHALEHGHRHIAFLSREGYLLQQVFARMWPHASAASRISHGYLLTSRRAARMAAMHGPGDLPALLGGSFRGTLGELLSARLGSGAHAAARGVLGDAELRRNLFLPEQQAELVETLQPVMAGLLEQACREREAYTRYWQQQVGERAVLLADVGYAGSIQAALSRMTGRPLAGAYFALRQSASATLGSAPAHARYCDQRLGNASHGDMSDTCTILRHDLLLETLLTAPDGQLDHFTLVDGEPRPQHRPHALDAAQLQVVDAVHRGCLAFIDDYLAVAGGHWLDAPLDARLVQQPLQCLGTSIWRVPELQSLRVDDFHSGRGLVGSAT